jgi:hypothetical protein
MELYISNSIDGVIELALCLNMVPRVRSRLQSRDVKAFHLDKVGSTQPTGGALRVALQ